MKDWDKAEKHLLTVERAYLESGVGGIFALVMFINPLIKRFNSGERSDELYNEILSLEI
jgi:hypothetical protein